MPKEFTLPPFEQAALRRTLTSLANRVLAGDPNDPDVRLDGQILAYALARRSGLPVDVDPRRSRGDEGYTIADSIRRVEVQLESRMKEQLRFKGLVLFSLSLAYSICVILALREARRLAKKFNAGELRPSCDVGDNLDKWAHCYIGCRMRKACPIDLTTAALVGVAKETWDSLDPDGTGWDWKDLEATLKGNWRCGGKGCDECCCRWYQHDPPPDTPRWLEPCLSVLH